MNRSKYRFLFMVLAGIVIHFLLDTISPEEERVHSEWLDLLFSILITFIVWEGNLWIDYWANIRYPWLHKPLKRIAVQFPLGMAYAAFTIYFSMLLYNKFICQLPEEAQSKFVVASMIIGLFVSLILLTAEISSQFFAQWKLSLVQVEKYKAESLQAQLQNIKNQINPHFLFNNLSVLSSLVYKDQDKAVDFINQISKVYRYLLENSNKELVSLEKEVNFIYSYNYLLKIRFDTNIDFSIDINGRDLQLLIPPMALQMLVENTVKHNEVSSEQNLRVDIFCHENYLVVRNNFQPRRNMELTTGTGLKNIKDRYKYFTEQQVIVKQEGDFFEVRIPLLSNT